MERVATEMTARAMAADARRKRMEANPERYPLRRFRWSDPPERCRDAADDATALTKEMLGVDLPPVVQPVLLTKPDGEVG